MDDKNACNVGLCWMGVLGKRKRSKGGPMRKREMSGALINELHRIAKVYLPPQGGGIALR